MAREKKIRKADTPVHGGGNQPDWVMSEELLQKTLQLLGEDPIDRRRGGRPSVPAALKLRGVFYILRTGQRWKDPNPYTSGSVAHAFFHHLVKTGFFERLQQEVSQQDEARLGIEWLWEALKRESLQSRRLREGTPPGTPNLVAEE